MEIAKAGVLGGADAVLGPGAGAVAALQGDDVLVLFVGEQDLEAVALVIGEGKLRARVRALAAADGPRALGPAGQVEIQLGHPGPSALGPVWRTAGRHASSGRARMASRTGSLSSNPGCRPPKNHAGS
jgi:hypothetical protein